MARRLMLCAAALLAAGCTHIVGGTAVPGYGAAPNLSGVDVNRVLLDQSRMQAITGGGEHLTIIPSMDGDSPVDIDALAPSAPPECRFVFADSATFGPDIETFHKTTYPGSASRRSDLGRRCRLPRRRYRPSRIQRPGGNRWPLRGQLCRFEVRRYLEVRRTVAADPPRRLRARLSAQVRGADRGHLLRIPGLGVHDRDHQHRRQRAGLAVGHRACSGGGNLAEFSPWLHARREVRRSR